MPRPTGDGDMGLTRGQPMVHQIDMGITRMDMDTATQTGIYVARCQVQEMLM